MLTKNQKHQIAFMRIKGIGYRSIATNLVISRDKVRSFCVRNNLSGFGSEIVCSEDNSNKFEYRICLYCGKELIQNTNVGRRKKYCYIVCKKAYEKEHPKLYTFDNSLLIIGKDFKKSCIWLFMINS